MIDIKAHIYNLLTESEAISEIVGDNVKYFADDSDEMQNFDDRLPQITYARISGTTNAIGIRSEFFQLSAWDSSPTWAEQLSNAIVQLFNRTQDTTYFACTVEHVTDTYDRETRAHGVHITAKFTIYDPSY